MALLAQEESPVTNATAEVIALPARKLLNTGTWSPEARAKREKTWAKKRKERARLARKEGRKGRRGASPIVRPRAAYAGRQAAKGGIEQAIGPHTGPQERRKGRQAGEQRLDAIAYLRAAVEGYEAIPTSVCLSLLALRRLLGQIK